jgi:hypothetical protein
MELPSSLSKISRNPLGIVALFISLIYGIASLLVGATASTLSAVERWPLILFVVFFPVLVLGVFYKLVTEHHGKLYAPADYKDDKSFLHTLSETQKEKKLKAEVTDVVSVRKPEQKVESESPEKKDGSESRDSRRAEYRSFRQRVQILEKLVIAQLENEYKVPAIRDVSIGSSSNVSSSFDAAFDLGSKGIVAVEVLYVRNNMAVMHPLQRVLYAAMLARDQVPNIKLLLVAVSESDSEEELTQLKRRILRQSNESPIDITVRVYPYHKFAGNEG